MYTGNGFYGGQQGGYGHPHQAYQMNYQQAQWHMQNQQYVELQQQAYFSGQAQFWPCAQPASNWGYAQQGMPAMNHFQQLPQQSNMYMPQHNQQQHQQQQGSWREPRSPLDGHQYHQPAEHNWNREPRHELPRSPSDRHEQPVHRQPRDSVEQHPRQVQHRQHGHKGGKAFKSGGRPQPDISLGFADTAIKVKYDELPPKAPAFLKAAYNGPAKASTQQTEQQAHGETQAPSDEAFPAAAATAAEGQQVAVAGRELLPILMFDLNGTLTSHTAQRRSTGITRIRPGVDSLALLSNKFRIGIFSSATHRTVAEARKLLEQAAGQPILEPGLILHRDHTKPAPKGHVQAGGDPWDTVKPLGDWFKHLHRILLFDDDQYKSLKSERGNLVLVPKWEDEDEQCPVLLELAAALEQELGGLGPEADVRERAAAISARLHAAAAARAAETAPAADASATPLRTEASPAPEDAPTVAAAE